MIQPPDRPRRTPTASGTGRGRPGPTDGPGPVSLRVSVTDRCPLRCLYCMPPEGVPQRDRAEVLSLEEIARFVRVVRRGFGLAKVHLTGGEPLVRPGLTSLVAMLAREARCDLALTTSGQGLAPVAADLRRAGLRRVNVSLDSLDPPTYRRLTRGGRVEEVVAGIEAARRAGLAPVKINTVVLRGFNDAEVPHLARWALRRGLHIRFLELMPIGCAGPLLGERFVPARCIRHRLGRAFDLEPIASPPGSTSRDFLATDLNAAGGCRGRIGLITPRSRPFCRGCRRLRLTSTGRLITCLSRGRGAGLRDLLRAPGPQAEPEVRRLLGEALARKARRPHYTTPHLMATVGG